LHNRHLTAIEIYSHFTKISLEICWKLLGDLSGCDIFYACVAEAHSRANQWIAYFTSTENRHALPLFTSLLNVVCAYDPVGYGMPYNHLMFTDSREPLVEVALHVLCATLEGSEPAIAPSDVIAGTANVKPANEVDDCFVLV